VNIKTLEYRKHNQIAYLDIRSKYFTNNIITKEPILLTSDEIKSMISLLFCFKFHYPNLTDINSVEIRAIIYEKAPLFNITIDFGRHMIENLDRYYTRWLKHIEKSTFRFDNMFNNNNEIIDFIEMALLDYMSIRNWEFGKFFIQEFSKIIINPISLDLNSMDIRNALEKDSNYLIKIGEKISESQTNLKTHESLLLVFALRERIIKEKIVPYYSYALTSYIVKENALELSLKINKFKDSLNKSLNLKWNRGKGRGI
jgi:hypothetical protein